MWRASCAEAAPPPCCLTPSPPTTTWAQAEAPSEGQVISNSTMGEEDSEQDVQHCEVYPPLLRPAGGDAEVGMYCV